MKPCRFAIHLPHSDYRECGLPATHVCRVSGAPLCEDHAEDFRRFCGEPLDPIRPQATVAEVVARLQQLPQDLPCLFRPKYHGDVSYSDEVPVSIHGISVMVPPNSEIPDRVVFLC